MRRIALVTVVIVLSLGSGLPHAGAVTYGESDGNGHPFVGIVRMFDDDGIYLWRCSGTLLAPTVFLTAGHCTFPDGDEIPARAAVWFTPTAPPTPEDESLQTLEYFTTQVAPPASLGTPITHPDYANFAGFPNTHDLAVVELDTPVVMSRYGALPGVGTLDQYARSAKHDVFITTVGYGLQSVRPTQRSDTERYVSMSDLVNLRSALTGGFNLQTTNNPGNGGTGTGGSCFGDSGGPVFLRDTNVVVAVVSFGLSPNCTGNNDFSFRVDTADSLAFINSHLAG